MVSDSQKILDARIEKIDVPKIYKKVASLYDLWGRLTEIQA